MVTQVIAKPGSVKTYKRFEAEIYVLTKDEGGRHTAFFSNYRPQFYLRTADITGKVELPENVKMVMPGDNVTAVFELISAVPLEAGVSLYNCCLVVFSGTWTDCIPFLLLHASNERNNMVEINQKNYVSRVVVNPPNNRRKAKKLDGFRRVFLHLDLMYFRSNVS